MNPPKLSILGGLAIWIAGACLAPTSLAAVQGNPEGVEILTRGPIHEAFASTVLYNPEPGIIVSVAPPDPIEELPPSQQPVGDNVAWIPGYWGWDDEQSDFLWISGVWRNLPPGREWVPGYWSQVSTGYQWTSGYWADAGLQEVTYLPEPPASLEVGPSVAAPSTNHNWIPGSWRWRESRYHWQPGNWIEVRDDWAWSPSYYSWTPRGFIYVDGFWDYAIPRRGVLFAPVHFGRTVYSRPGFYYSPTVVISLSIFTDHLFLRPSYCHYYFGDYYAASYRRSGYYAPHHFHGSRRGFDPIFAHQRWRNRGDRDWDRRWSERYDHRRDDESARPPRTWASLQERQGRGGRDRDRSSFLAESLADYTSRRETGTRFQPVSREARERIVNQRQEIGRFREERQNQERAGARERTPARAAEVATAPRRRSPLVDPGTAPRAEDRREADRTPERGAGRGEAAAVPSTQALRSGDAASREPGSRAATGGGETERPQASRGPEGRPETRTTPGAAPRRAQQAERREAPRAAERPAPQTQRREAPQATPRPTPQAQRRDAPRAAERPAPQAQRREAPQATQRPVPQTQRRETPQAAPRPIPQMQRREIPQATQRPTPQATPRPTPRATPRATPRPAPQATPRATPRPTPQATPRVTPRPAPRAAPRPTPQVQRAQPQRPQPQQRAQPQRAQPQRAQPQRAQPQRAQPQRVQPQRVQPQRVQPQRAQPQRAQPQRAQPQRSAAPQPQRGGPDDKGRKGR